MGGGSTHYWRVRKWLPERTGQGCRVLARGARNSCLVEFGDGVQVVTSRWFVRRYPAGGPSTGPRTRGVELS